MTELTKPVHRKSGRSYAVLYAKARPIVVTMLPGDVLEFREHGRRARFHLAFDTAFKYAVRLYAFALVAEKQRARKARRFGGGR